MYVCACVCVRVCVSIHFKFIHAYINKTLYRTPPYYCKPIPVLVEIPEHILMQGYIRHLHVGQGTPEYHHGPVLLVKRRSTRKRTRRGGLNTCTRVG